MKRFLACLALLVTPALFAADAANDVILFQRNAANDDNVQRNITSTANALILLNGASSPAATANVLLNDTTGAITGLNSVTAKAATDLTLSGGSSGASLVLGQGTNGAATLTSLGTGNLILASASVVRVGTGGLVVNSPFGSLPASFNGIALDNTITGGGGRILVRGSDASTNGGLTFTSQRADGTNTISLGVWASTQNLLIGGTTDISGSGGLKVYGSTASTSTTTGSLINAGGLGNAGKIFAGNDVNTATKFITTLTGGEVFLAGSATTSQLFLTFNNTSGNGTFGIEASAGGTSYTGSTAYSTLLGNGVNKPLEFVTNANVRLRIAGGGDVSALSTTEATTGGAGSLTSAGGIYAAKKIIGATDILSVSPTAGMGYTTGAGGTVTQGTNRTTGVTLDKVTGAITLVSAAGTTSWQSFTVTCSAVAATDVVRVVQKSGTDKYMIHVTAVAAGSFQITFATTGGTTTEQPVFNYAIIKGASS